MKNVRDVPPAKKQSETVLTSQIPSSQQPPHVGKTKVRSMSESSSDSDRQPPPSKSRRPTAQKSSAQRSSSNAAAVIPQLSSSSSSSSSNSSPSLSVRQVGMPSRTEQQRQQPPQPSRQAFNDDSSLSSLSDLSDDDDGDNTAGRGPTSKNSAKLSHSSGPPVTSASVQQALMEHDLHLSESDESDDDNM